MVAGTEQNFAFYAIIGGTAQCANTARSLTRSLDLGEERLAMQATLLCSIEDCPNAAARQGWCWKHRWRWQKYGDPLHLAPRVTLEDRFWSKVNKDGPIPVHRPELGPCWAWTASTSGAGYGQFWITGCGLRGSHTVSWSLAHGPIPDGNHVCHHCDNPLCVRPDHLFLGTRSENMRDMGRKGRGGRGGVKGERNRNAKLTETQVIEIRTRFAAGELGYMLAAEFGLGSRKLSRIVCGHAWGHVGGPIQPWDSPRRKAARERYQVSLSQMDGAA